MTSSIPTHTDASTPNGCPFHQQTLAGGISSWVMNAYSFFSNDRFKFARDIVQANEPHIYKDYEWRTLLHSPHSLFVTDPNMISEIVYQMRDDALLSGGIEFQYALTKGIGNESPLTITDSPRHNKLRKFCSENEFKKGLKTSLPSIVQVAREFINSLSTEQNYNTTQLIPRYTVAQTSNNILKTPLDITHVANTIASVEHRITDFMLLHVKNLMVTQLEDFIKGENSFTELEAIAQDVINRATADNIIGKMQASGDFTEEEIKSLARTILFIGSGTTKSAITSALYSLMRDPEIQETLYESIKSIDLTNPDDSLYEELERHTELNCFLLEVLRLFPPILFQIRKTKQPYRFTCKELEIPEGTSIYMSLFHSYRDGRRWEDPEKFNPQRFNKLSEEGKTLNNIHRFNPFSTGNTTCIGQYFAKLIIKIFICTLLQKFKIVNPPDMEKQEKQIEGAMTLKFDSPLYIRLVERV